MGTLAEHDILTLSVPERIQLVEDIWDSIAEAPDSLLLAGAEKLELDHRLASYCQNPEECSTWGEVRDRIRSRR